MQVDVLESGIVKLSNLGGTQLNEISTQFLNTLTKYRFGKELRFCVEFTCEIIKTDSVITIKSFNRFNQKCLWITFGCSEEAIPEQGYRGSIEEKILSPLLDSISILNGNGLNPKRIWYEIRNGEVAFIFVQ